MTTIKVTPEQLLSVSRQFEAAQSQVFQMKRLKAEGPLNYNLDDATYARNFTLDEAQASIRAARFAPELASVERMTLLRDAVTRLKNADLRVQDVKNELYIQHK
ncbi:hypothetical protein [Paenibacillus sp. LK1]|uniref:hypothetical protein n=1 Tax=Paenibacillus sp. LK1 TaxID=2053014 RepID=UPI00211DC284|nr:hypothetical protein [Paenibacillus sp. LK1]